MLNLTPDVFEKIITNELRRLVIVDDKKLRKIYKIKDPSKSQQALTEFLASGTNTDEFNKIFRMGSDLTGFWNSLSDEQFAEAKLYEELHSKIVSSNIKKSTQKELKIYIPLKEKIKSLFLIYEKDFNIKESQRIFNNLSEMYYQAKASGENQHLVKEVEKAIERQS